MRQQRKSSEPSKRTPNDVFMEAKRRFQFKPGPSRKPHVHDIVGKSLKTQLKENRQKSTQNKSIHILSENRKSKEKLNKQAKTKLETHNKQTNIEMVKKMMKDFLEVQEDKEKDQELVFDINEKKIEIVLDVDSSKQLDSNLESRQEEEDKQKQPKEYQNSRCSYKKKPLTETRQYHQSKLFSKKKQFKSQKQSRNVSIQLKSPPQTNHYNKPHYSKSKENQMKKTFPLKSKEKVIIQNQIFDHNRHLSSIEILQISQPHTNDPTQSPLSFNFTDFDIQVENIKDPQQSVQLFKSYEHKNIQRARKYKYDTEEQSKSHSIMSLSPVKNYEFDKEQKLMEIELKKKKMSIELTKGVKQTIIEEEEDKSSHSRVLDIKFNQIFDVIDSQHLGIINYKSHKHSNLHPQIQTLINPIILRLHRQNKSFNKKQFLIEVKRIIGSMKDKELDSIVKCPILRSKTNSIKSASKNIRTEFSCDKTVPLKQISRAPYMRLNTRNSVGEIELSKLSAQDSLQLSSQSITQPSLQPQFISDRRKEVDRISQRYQPLYSMRRSLQSQLDVSRIDALNQRLSTYIQRNNIKQNRYSSDQINLDFNQLKKHLGFS